MANRAKLEITFTGIPNIDEYLEVTASGSGISGVPITMGEIAKSIRTTSGHFAIGGTANQCASNMREAFNLDFVYYQNRPFVTAVVNNVVTFESTAWGVSFAYTNTLSNITIVDTPEALDPIAIDTINTLTASDDPCNNVRHLINLKTGQKGTPPYTIYYYQGAKSGIATEAELWVERSRTLGYNYDNIQVKDSLDNYVESNIPGVQLWDSNTVKVSFREIGSGLVQIQIQVSMKKYPKKKATDIFIKFSYRVRDGLGAVINDWSPYSEENPEWVYILQRPTGAYIIDIKDDYGCEKLNFATYAGYQGDPVNSKCMKSNSLDFIKVTENTYKTLENTTHRDYEIKNSYNLQYCQKYLQSSNQAIQFQSTAVSTVNAYLIDENSNKVDITGSLSVIQTIAGIKWVKLAHNIASLNGVYQYEVHFTDGVNSEKWVSQWFEVRPSYDIEMCLIKWRNLDTSYSYPDGMVWLEGEYQEMLFEGEFINSDIGGEKTMLTDTNNQLININSEPTAIDVLAIYRVPLYMKEKIQLAFAHYYCEINGIEYQMTELPEFTQYGGNLLYRGEIKLQRVNYEIY